MSNTDKVLDGKNKSIEFVKNKAFDIIAVGIIVAMSVLSLGVVELREINAQEIVNIIIECIPFYVSATMLSVNYYNKGVYLAKNGSIYINAVKQYSEHVNKLDGKQLSYISIFCKEFNDKALRNLRTSLLRSVALTFEIFDEGNQDVKPLKSLTKKELLIMYNEEVVKVIQKCKKAKIKGIHSNILLGKLDSADCTDLGPTEEAIHRKRTAGFVGSYAFSIFLMSLIGVKDAMQWGWMGAFLTLFKVLYIACRAYMKYFNGYEDINTYVVNHTYRKTDIIKEFQFWYENRISTITQG